MEITDNGADYVSAPANYADFFRLYRTYVVQLVKRQHIDPRYAEDVASEIMLRFMERDMLSVFDPTLSFEYEGQMRPAKFKSFLSKVVILYCKGHRNKISNRMKHEWHLIDIPPHPDGNLWVDSQVHTDPHEGDVVEMLGEERLVTELRDYLGGVPRRSRWDTCDLVALFDAVVEQVRISGAWNIADLRRVFGISSTAMHSWMWWLRANIAHALNRPVPPKRVRTNTNPTPRNAT